MSGNIAKIRAYGFSGKSPYHFSRIYFRPCATRIENGKMMNTMASGLKPVIMIVKTMRRVAMELREAKKPLVVENRPISPMAKIGRLMSGERNTLSRLLFQENTNANPDERLLKKFEIWKSRENNNSIAIDGLLIILIIRAAMPARTKTPMIISGIFGRFLMTKRRCGWVRTNTIQRTAK